MEKTAPPVFGQRAPAPRLTRAAAALLAGMLSALFLALLGLWSLAALLVG